MYVLCSWCGEGMGEKEPYDDKETTHGMCTKCYNRETRRKVTTRKIDFAKQWYPSQYPLIRDLTEEQLKLNILRFAWYHGVNICPEKNLDAYVGRLKASNHCACHDNRFCCPCLQAVNELKERGYCTCRLFVHNKYLKIVQKRVMRKIRENPDTWRPDK